MITSITEKIAGLLLAGALATAGLFLSRTPWLQALQISPLIIAILLGIIFGNTMLKKQPERLKAGIVFAQKKVLRLGIILFGLRLTWQQVAAVGLQGLIVDIVIVVTVFLLGSLVGIKILKMDRDTAFLTASGSAICGAAAVLAVEPILNSKPHKTALAVSTVVLFGTISMFLYPLLLRVLPISAADGAIYIGSTVHEVAQVVAAGNMVGSESAEIAIVVKMTRVILLVPFLLLLSLYVATTAKDGDSGRKARITIPWFAVLFLLMITINSLLVNGFGAWLTDDTASRINTFDTWLLAVAMGALGLDTGLQKMRQSGGKPLLLALILFAYLVVGGFAINRLAATIL